MKLMILFSVHEYQKLYLNILNYKFTKQNIVLNYSSYNVYVIKSPLGVNG